MVLIGLIGLTNLVSAAPPAPPSIACPDSADFEGPQEALQGFASAIQSGKPVDILVIGSASSLADGANGFIAQTVQALRAAFPQVTFNVTVQAHHGMTAGDMLIVLKQALDKHAYPLVLWQTGTVEAVQGIRPDDFASQLQDGAAMVTAQGGNLVLIDQQFSRFLRSNTDLQPYAGAIAAAAALPGVEQFHRFDLMHSWVAGGDLDLERTPQAQAAAVVTRLHYCLGQSLAQFLLTGIGR